MLVAAEIRALQEQQIRLAKMDIGVMPRKTILALTQVLSKLREIEMILVEIENTLSQQRRKTAESCALESQTGVASTSFATRDEFIEWAEGYQNP